MPKDKEDQLSLDNYREKSKTDEDTDLEGLARQVQAEYELAWQHQKPKKDEQLLRLKLYNNQKRDKKSVGDTTLFTIHQTILASLYNDRLTSEWSAREEGDEEQAENANALTKFDFKEMGKDELDYYWMWDTAFFGRAVVEIFEYIRDPDKKMFVPVPELLDTATLLRDPRASSLNGNRNRKGAARFYGQEIRITRNDMEENPNFFKNIDWKNLSYGDTTKSLIEDAKQARSDAQGTQNKKYDEGDLGVNAEYTLTRWNTHFKLDGEVKKVRVWLANGRKKVIGLKVLDKGVNTWPAVDRALYPTSNDWDGTSIPDLTEDKQRARALAQNLGLDALKQDLYANFIYDLNKIPNRGDLHFGYNKHIPVDGPVSDQVIQPTRKHSPNMQLLDFIYETLDISAQKATATPEIQQGQLSTQQRTLGEINLVASKVDTRYNLSAKIFSWSEERFWQLWYQCYKVNFEDDIDEKVLRLVGALGAKWRPLVKKDFIGQQDLDIEIRSQVMVREEEFEKRTLLSNYFGLLLADPNANKRYIYRMLGKLNGLENDQMDRALPLSIDERRAEKENDLLNENADVDEVPVLREDDHIAHLDIHAKANQTDAAIAHIETHEDALALKKTNPEFFPEDQAQQEQEQGAPGAPDNTNFISNRQIQQTQDVANATQ